MLLLLLMPRRIFARKRQLLRGLNPTAQLVFTRVVGKPVVYIHEKIYDSRFDGCELLTVVCVLMYFIMYKGIIYYYYNTPTPLPSHVMVEKEYNRNPKDFKHTNT